MTTYTSHLRVHSIQTDTGNYSKRRSTSINSANTPKALNENPSERRRRRRPNENERRKRNTLRKLMRSSWRHLKALGTMGERKDSSGALRTQRVESMHTVVPKWLRVPSRGLVHSLCVSVPILKPRSRCLHPLRPNGQRGNAPWIPSWKKSSGK